MSTINAQTIINAVMQAHACAPDEGSDLISFAISAKGVQKVKNCKANLLRFAELVRKNARAFGGGIARTIKPRAAVIWPAQAVRLVYELLQDEQYQDAAALAEEQCGAVFYEFFNNVEEISEAKMIFAPRSVAGLGDEFASGRRENGLYCVFHLPSGLTISGHQRTRKAAEEIATKTWSEASEEQRAHVPTHTRSRSQEAARAQWMAEHGIINEEATAARIEAEELAQEEAATLGQRFDAERAKRRAARDAERAAQAVAQVVADAVASIAISEAMQPSEATESRELVTCEAGDNEANAPSVGSASSAAWSPILQFSPCSPIDTGFGQSKPPAFRGDDNGGEESPSTPPLAVSDDANYRLPDQSVYTDWNGSQCKDFAPDTRQQMVIDAVSIALNEGLFYTTDVHARCVELLNVSEELQAVKTQRVEGGDIGMDFYYARGHIEAKKSREYSMKIIAEMDIRMGDKLGILVFSDYKRTTGVTVTEVSGNGFTFTGKRGAYTVTGTGTCCQIKDAIERAFTKGSRKTDYPAFLESQAKRPAPTPPAVESQPVAAAPVVETEPTTYAERKAQIDKDYSHIPEGNRPPAFIYGEGLETWQMDASTFSRQSRDNPHWSQSYPCGDGDYLRDCFATHAAIVAAHEAQDVPAVTNEKAPGLQSGGSKKNTTNEVDSTLSPEVTQRDLRTEWLTAWNAGVCQWALSKSGNWRAWLFKTSDNGFGLRFSAHSGETMRNSTHATPRERMEALQVMARAADAPDDTPPTGGLPCPDSQASNPPGKTEGREGSPVQISTPKPVETFKQAGPVRVDLASMIAKGVAPEALIGLGVYCKGDMANPSGSGAITGFSHSDFYGLVVDVTLESGKVWRAVRTGEFLTGWFSLDAKMHGAPYLAQLAATVASLKASASATKEQAGNARAKALIDLAEQYPQLKRAETSYAGGKLAAANMRILLKAAFKGVKFSVTSDYNSVRVNWEDGPTDDQVNEVVGRFDIGASDAHSDYFYTVSTAFSDLFGGVQYLHTRRHESDALVQQAIDELYQNRDEKPTVQDYRKCSVVFNWDGQNYENRRMRELMNSTPAFSATKSHAKS